MPGRLIVLNGASSAGKSTLCRALLEVLPEPFLWFPLDLFLDGDLRPKRRDGRFAWTQRRAPIFAGHLACLRALAEAGNNVLTDVVLESQAQADAWQAMLEGLDVFWVGVHCSLEELERRELARGNRSTGDARRDLETVHSFRAYDLEIDSTQPTSQNVESIARGWQAVQSAK